MPNNEKTEITADAIMSKLDAIDKRLETIETANKPKEDSKDEKSQNPLINMAREALAGSFEKSKLDAMTEEQLGMAWEIKKNFKPAEPEKQLPDPPKGKKDAQIEYKIGMTDLSHMEEA